MASGGLKKKAVNKTYPGFEKGGDGTAWEGPFFFVQGADTQFGMTSTFDGSAGWEKEVELARQAIRLINHMTPAPKFFVVCGDMVDAMPGTRFRSAQERDFVATFSDLRDDVPLVCVCGNHDVGDRPTRQSVATYKDTFGDDYFSFFVGGVMFLVINSQYFEDPSLVRELAQEHEMWLDEQLEEAKTGKYKHVVIFQHIPWFLRDHQEDEEYFNIMPELRQKMLQKFYDANVRAIFCGHYHRNAGGYYRDLELVVTSAVGYQLGRDKSGFRIVKVDEQKISHKYIEFEKAPENIILR